MKLDVEPWCGILPAASVTEAGTIDAPVNSAAIVASRLVHDTNPKHTAVAHTKMSAPLVKMLVFSERLTIPTVAVHADVGGGLFIVLEKTEDVSGRLSIVLEKTCSQRPSRVAQMSMGLCETGECCIHTRLPSPPSMVLRHPSIERWSPSINL